MSPAGVSVLPLSRRAVVFRLAGQACALPLERVQEVLPMATLLRPPGLPALLEGFLNLGGAAVPVIHLCRLFGLPWEAPGLYTPLLVVSGHPGPLALLVDEVTDLLSVDQKALVQVREDQVFNDCVEAEIDLGDRTLHLLSPDRLLLEEERQRVAALREAAQERLAALAGSDR
ncbi:MAG: chemotaxis protein CheW [Candidatus Latescibacteria bacterium]|nr:chemotaxis protein CheW [Candidatus Latescibacterota bacterium]